MDYTYNEHEYMGYLEDGAAYQLKGVKRYIGVLPEFFKGYQDRSKAESIIYYKHGRRTFYCSPSGILSAKRGRHPHGMICDDILRDPQKRLDVTQLDKIKRAFLEEVSPMPKEFLHVVGTPQDEADLLNYLATVGTYDSKNYPAEDVTTGQILWPENFPREKLENIKREIGQKAYRKEYLCAPVRSEETYIDKVSLLSCVRKRLKNYVITKDKPPRLNEYTVAGMDVGKKRHPSHLVVYGIDSKKRMVQIYSKFMDGWDYNKQIEHCSEVMKFFRVDFLLYDGTRGEFEAIKERGEMPDGMIGVNFTNKGKNAMAFDFGLMVEEGRIHLLNDERQFKQIMQVDNDLVAVETEDGHGDAFWSNALAVAAYHKTQGTLIWEISSTGSPENSDS